MHFPDLTHHSRARAKSVHFDRVKALFSSTESLNDDDPIPLVRPSSVPVQSIPGLRSVSLNATTQENVPLRRYKSMLDVDEAPKLPATKPMTYDELYVEHLPDPVPKPPTRALEIAKYWKSSHTSPLVSASTMASLLDMLSFYVTKTDDWCSYSCKRCRRLLFAANEGISDPSSS